jgi:hypothetical protein
MLSAPAVSFPADLDPPLPLQFPRDFMGRLDRSAALVLAVALTIGAVAPSASQSVAAAIPDREFWSLITTLSEPGGAFAQQLMSNEDSVGVVIPKLQATIRPGGIYVGVGSEQNFTYVAALRPRLAFVVDIRRENVVEMLMYKALFEMSADRAEFVSRLFARPRPADLDERSSVAALFAAYAAVPPDATFFDRNVAEAIDRLTRVHGFPIDAMTQSALAGMLGAFRTAGPQTLKGWGDRTNPTFAQLLSATDLDGQQNGFLASEENYRVVRGLQQQNLIVPVVGDFAGDHALPAIARYLADRKAVLDVFYVSNVERYLFEQGDHGQRFYANVAMMPLASSSVFVRSVTRAISERLGIAVPAGSAKWWTFVTPIQECLDGITRGRIRNYGDLFVTSR